MNSGVLLGALAVLTQAGGVCTLLVSSSSVGRREETSVVGFLHRRHPDGQTEEQYCGSVEAPPNAYPYQVSIQLLRDGVWYHLCGGSIVENDKIITAAGCINQFGSRSIRVVAGEQDLAFNDGTEQVRTVKFAKIHPNFTKASLNFDYGVIRLTQPFSLNRAVNTVPLSVVEPAYGNCIYTGYGILYDDSLLIPHDLQHTNTSIVTREVCSKYFESAITKQMICRSVVSNWTCYNCGVDPGSPLTCNGSLAGIASAWYSSCDYPRVFASVAAARQWLRTA